MGIKIKLSLMNFSSFCSWFIRLSIPDCKKLNVTDAVFLMIRNRAAKTCKNIHKLCKLYSIMYYLAYKAYLSGLDCQVFGMMFDLGILIAAVFPICAAYRLARFNVSADPNSFRGLPSPVAGILIALFPFYFRSGDITLPVFGLVFVVVGLLMVSTVKYSKPNSYFFQNLQGIKITILVLALVLVAVFFKEWSVLILFLLYILTGIISFVIQFIQEHKY